MADALVLSPDLMRSLERRAAERGTTPAALAEAVLRRELGGGAGAVVRLPPLPTFHGGQPLVDLSDREALDEVLNGERDRRLYGRLLPDDRP